MREKIQTWISILIIIILLPYVAAVFRTGSMNGNFSKDAPGLETYVAGILPGQIPVMYEEEALKAQAVVVRTNLLYKGMQFYGEDTVSEAEAQLREKDLEAMGFTYYTPADLQELWGYEQWENYEERIKKAVKDTSGEILVRNAVPVDIPFHAVSAGNTREGSILGAGYEHLVSARCAGDLQAMDYLKIIVIPKKAVSMSLPEILVRDKAGYVTKLRLGEEIISGEEFRKRYALNSSNFTVEETSEGIRITTKGLGHGFGMSLFQANLQALEGCSYREILSYFYKDTECISFP